jgi:hypothetical protein
VKISAHELCKTRLCRATDCGYDAEPYSRLCWSCQRKDDAGRRIAMHVIPQRPAEELRCSTCNIWQPDDAFPKKNRTHRDGRLDRRGRHYECRACSAKRRQSRVYTPEQRALSAARDKARRAAWTPEQRERNARKDRERRAAKRALLETLRQSLDSQPKAQP